MQISVCAFNALLRYIRMIRKFQNRHINPTLN